MELKLCLLNGSSRRCSFLKFVDATCAVYSLTVFVWLGACFFLKALVELLIVRLKKPSSEMTLNVWSQEQLLRRPIWENRMAALWWVLGLDSTGYSRSHIIRLSWAKFWDSRWCGHDKYIFFNYLSFKRSSHLRVKSTYQAIFGRFIESNEDI